LRSAKRAAVPPGAGSDRLRRRRRTRIRL